MLNYQHSGQRAVRLDVRAVDSEKRYYATKMQNGTEHGRAKYAFAKQCEEAAGLKPEDGTTKLFLNMSSKNGDPVPVRGHSRIKTLPRRS